MPKSTGSRSVLVGMRERGTHLSRSARSSSLTYAEGRCAMFAASRFRWGTGLK